MTRIAKDIMVTKLVTLEPETPVLLGIQKLIRSNIKGAPVVDSDRNYQGIFTERCCLNVLTKLLDRRGWAHPAGPAPATCGDIMARKLWTLSPEMDAFDAVSFLLAHRISGAPVVDDERRFLGVFSESGSMRVLIGAIYDSLPGAEVRSYMDRSPERTCKRRNRDPGDRQPLPHAAAQALAGDARPTRRGAGQPAGRALGSGGVGGHFGESQCGNRAVVDGLGVHGFQGRYDR